MKFVAIAIIGFGGLLLKPGKTSIQSNFVKQDYEVAIRRIAKDIELRKKHFVQLKEFQPLVHTDCESLKISYSFKTHRTKHSGGWTSGMPNPDDKGIWFYIDFHLPDSKAQIHVQPQSADLCI